MTFHGWAQIALYGLIILALTRPLGGYMTRLFAGERSTSGEAFAALAAALATADARAA